MHVHRLDYADSTAFEAHKLMKGAVVSTGSKSYRSTDIVIIVPSRNRPQKLRNLLESIACQTLPVKQVVVVSSGEPITHVIDEYAKSLKITHKHDARGGQIRQRNIAVKCVDSSALLIATLDDDIVLLPNAVENMVAFWNRISPETAGVGFNIITEEEFFASRFLIFMGLSAAKPGLVLRSGAVTPVTHVASDTKTQWLCGGATVWKKRFLDERHHEEIKSRWAVAEDLMFSYPIGLCHPLYVCASACVRHEHVRDQFIRTRASFLRGKYLSMWQLLFVTKNPGLSIIRQAWYFSVHGLVNVVRGLLQAKTEMIYFGTGILIGEWLALYRLMTMQRIVFH